MDRDSLVELSIFVAVADELSFTKAAAKLGTSQSALSRSMRRLESRMGVRLLSRTTRSVAPTEAGERLLSKLRPAFAEIDEEITSLGELRDKPSGTVRITTSKHAATTILWPKLATLLRDTPDVHVEVIVDGGFADVVSDRFDAGVRLGEALAKDMVAVKIGPDLRMAVVGSPDYFAGRAAPTSPQDLHNHTCINQRRISSGALYAWDLESQEHEIRVRVEGQMIFNDEDMIVRAALDGYGLAYVMEDFVLDVIEDGRLVRVLEDWCVPFPGYHLYYPSRRQPSAAFSMLVNGLRHRG